MNTAAFGIVSQEYCAVRFCTLLYFWYIGFVICYQNKLVWDIMTNDVNYINCFSVS